MFELLQTDFLTLEHIRTGAISQKFGTGISHHWSAHSESASISLMNQMVEPRLSEVTSPGLQLVSLGETDPTSIGKVPDLSCLHITPRLDTPQFFSHHRCCGIRFCSEKPALYSS